MLRNQIIRIPRGILLTCGLALVAMATLLAPSGASACITHTDRPGPNAIIVFLPTVGPGYVDLDGTGVGTPVDTYTLHPANCRP